MRDLARNVYYRQNMDHSHSPFQSRQSNPLNSSMISQSGGNPTSTKNQPFQQSQSPVSRKLLKDPNFHTFDFKNQQTSPLKKDKLSTLLQKKKSQQNDSPGQQINSKQLGQTQFNKYKRRNVSNNNNNKSNHSSVGRQEGQIQTSSNFTTQHDTNSSIQQKPQHKFENVRETSKGKVKSKKKFLNAYKSKENKMNPLDVQASKLNTNSSNADYTSSQPVLINIQTYGHNSTSDYQSNNRNVLIELAQNKQIVEWVTSMVNYHKQKSEEKKVIDLYLQCLYKVLFPEQKSDIKMAQILNDLLDQVGFSKYAFQSQFQQTLVFLKKVIVEIENIMNNEFDQVAEKILIKLQDVAKILNLNQVITHTLVQNTQQVIPHRKESSICSFPNNITVSEIEEPLMSTYPVSIDMNKYHQPTSSFQDYVDPKSLRISMHSTSQIYNLESHRNNSQERLDLMRQSNPVVERRQLINEPKSMEAKIGLFQEKFEQSKLVHDNHQQLHITSQQQYQQQQNLLQSSFNYPQQQIHDKYRSQSEGQKLIKHIEESLESISQYMKFSDSSQSLSNTMQNMNNQLSNQNSFTRSKLSLTQMLNQQSPIKETRDKSRDSQNNTGDRLVQSNGNRILDEQVQRLKHERLMYEDEKRNLQNQLDEAIVINTKLLEKVKRLEGQIRELLHNRSQ
ncbi:UNKNOWN [Stylonychia lemnae]|uniref:Uncharacterized protein n=1 Tax=Stylonychia lemnae TaxID=5949 RepID=A0A078A612_STYLE|nr:UNKNOWN [Stylonychia lemnae]|eukprot:CDW76194.1 UNKNOWN [Stylonychia lemnae]